MADEGPTIEARIGAYEVYASRQIIVDGGQQFTLLPLIDAPDFTLTIDIRIVEDINNARTWSEPDDNGYPRIVVERPFSTINESSSSSFASFAMGDRYIYYINFVVNFIGDADNHSIQFSYMLSRKIK